MTTTSSPQPDVSKALARRSMALARLPERHLLADITQEDLDEIMRENFRDMDPEFVRVLFPRGGGSTFEIPTATGTDAADHLEGAILLHHVARAYWPGAFSGGNPPECSSVDGKTGTKYGACATCRFNLFGTAIGQDGRPRAGKACKEVRRIYLQREGDLFPVLLALPPTSLRSFQEYMKRLSTSGITPSMVVTNVGLTFDSTSDGIKYSVATFAAIGQVTGPDRAKLLSLAKDIQEAARRVGITQEDYNAAEAPLVDPDAAAAASLPAQPVQDVHAQGAAAPATLTWAQPNRPVYEGDLHVTGTVVGPAEIRYEPVTGAGRAYMILGLREMPEVGVLVMDDLATFIEAEISQGGRAIFIGIDVPDCPLDASRPRVFRAFSWTPMTAAPAQVPPAVMPAAQPARAPASQAGAPGGRFGGAGKDLL